MELKVPLKDLYVGKGMQVLINRVVPEESATEKTRCTTCKYTETVLEQHQIAPGFVQQVQRKVAKQFTCCEQEDTVQVEIERGMPDGHKIEYEGYGEHNPTQEAGKIIFTVATEDDKLFRREGNDLWAEMSIPLRDALVGFEKSIRHVDGHEVRVKKEGVTQPDEVLVIQDEGMPQYESPSIKGNLHIRFTILFPNVVTDDQKERFRQILG